MERSLIEHGGAAGRAIKQCVDHFRVAERQRIDGEIQAVQADIQTIESALQKKPTKTTQANLDTKIRKLQKLQQAMTMPSVATAGGYRI